MPTALLLVSLIFGLCQAAPPASDGASDGRLVARVGAQQISRADFIAEVDRLIPQSFFHNKVSADVRRTLHGQALDSLIEKSLIHQDALAAGLQANKEDVAAEFERTLEKAGPQFSALSEADKAALLESYRPLVVRRILRDKAEARMRASIPEVTEELLAATYAERQQEFLAPEQAHFRHIMAAVDPSATSAEAEAAQKRLEGLLPRLVSGESFEQLARETSDDIYAASGGDMGFVTRGAFRTPNLDQVAFALADGETSGVIASIYGYHIVQRVESSPQHQLGFDEVRDQLIAELEQTLAAQTRQAWLDGLRQRFDVQVLDDPTQWEIEMPPPGGPGHLGHP